MVYFDARLEHFFPGIGSALAFVRGLGLGTVSTHGRGTGSRWGGKMELGMETMVRVEGPACSNPLPR